ncbi:MAG: DUF624 domain-containing protein [Anaerolineae bacterium]
MLRLFARAIALWWREFPFLLVLNLVWLLAQVTVVLGPPATAALVAVAGRVADGELTDCGDFWRALQANFGTAWRWGLAQGLVYGVLGFNLVAYAGRDGASLLSLRYAWTLLALAWFAVNLYFWPLHFEQIDRRFTITLSNAAKMALLNPGFTAAYTLLALAFIGISIFSGLLLGAVMAAWLALWSTLIVRHLLTKASP